MRYILHFFSTFFIISFTLITPVLAGCNLTENKAAADFLKGCSEEMGSDVTIVKIDSLDERKGIEKRVGEIAKGAISLGALLAVGAIVWAGTQYTKAFGDDEKLKKAKTTGIYALIGLLLLMGSFSLVDVVINTIYKIAGSNP